MSAFSDFLTQGAAPWWGSGLIGIGGTLLGIGINSKIASKRDQKQAERDAVTKAAQNQLDDRRRWEAEIRDNVVEIDRIVNDIKNQTYSFRTDMASEERESETQFLADHRDELDRLRSSLRVIAPTEIYEAADKIWHAVAMLRHTRDSTAFDEIWGEMVQSNTELMKKIRVALRIPEES